MNEVINYNSGNLKKYSSKFFPKKLLINQFNEKLLEKIYLFSYNSPPPIRILDAGCGEGFITKLIKDKIRHAEIIGVDESIRALNEARLRNPNIKFLLSDISEMKFTNNAFDIVVCCEVLEHLKNPESAIIELKRVASKMLVLTVPLEPWFRIGNFMSLQNISRFGNPADHINHWTMSKFKRDMSNFFREYDCSWTISFPWIVLCACKKKNNE